MGRADGTRVYTGLYLLFRRTEAQWVELMDRVYSLEDQQKNAASNERIYRHQLPKKVQWAWYKVGVLYIPCTNNVI